MNIELKEIDRDSLKVGDVVGVASNVECGWRSTFRHRMIIPAKIIKITPKRTKIVSDKFGEHDKGEIFYEPDSNALKENHLAMLFDGFQRGVYELNEFKRKEEIGIISDSDLLVVAEHMKAITEILEKYRKE